MNKNINRLKTIHTYVEGINNHNLFEYSNSSFNASILDGRKSAEKFNTHNGNYSQDYQRLQQNERIIKRIINPKRCKIIQKSIQNVRSLERVGSNLEDRCKSQHHDRKRFLKVINFRDQFSSLNEKCPFLNFCRQDYDLKVQNERMGKRIIEAKPIVRTQQSFYKRPNSRVNKGVINFFHPRLSSRQNQRKVNQQNRQISRFKSYYGYGPTILCLRNIKINLSPPLKDDDLLFLQLMVKNANPKLYKTQIIPYRQLTKFEFKFALRIKRIGQFVPLRIWKINNMDSLEIGIVDIQFLKYLNLQEQANQILTENSQNQHGFISRNKQGKMRAVIKDKIECKMRKTKLQQAHADLCLQFLIYRKKYS